MAEVAERGRRISRQNAEAAHNKTKLTLAGQVLQKAASVLPKAEVKSRPTRGSAGPGSSTYPLLSWKRLSSPINLSRSRSYASGSLLSSRAILIMAVEFHFDRPPWALGMV